MHRILLILALIWMAAVPSAHAATISLPVDESPNGDVYRFRIENMTGLTSFGATFTVSKSYPCIGNSFADFATCPPSAFTSGGISAVAEQVDPQNPIGIELCNGFYGQPHSGSASCTRGFHSVTGQVSPQNPILELMLTLFGPFDTAGLVLEISDPAATIVQLSGPGVDRPVDPVPLPAAFPLLLAGLGALGCAARRGAKQQG